MGNAINASGDEIKKIDIGTSARINLEKPYFLSLRFTVHSRINLMKIILGSVHSRERLFLKLPVIVCESQIIFASTFLDMVRTCVMIKNKQYLKSSKDVCTLV